MSDICQEYKPEYNIKKDINVGGFANYNNKLRILAEKAKYEDWNFKSDEFRDDSKPYPILDNYLNFTYDRLKQEGKIAYTEDGKAMCFNTGLQTREYEVDIYAYCTLNQYYPETSSKKWFMTKFCDAYDLELRKFEKLPDIADYIEDASDLVFDKNYSEIRLQYEHIISENKDRFKVIGEDDTYKLLQMLKGACEIAQKRVKRNYKLAIPQFFQDKNSDKPKIQLLLPLCMKDRNKADLALVVEKDEKAYVGKTILPLDWAYMNSRRIVRPDAEWIVSI